jgi:uncharacterized protein
VLLRFEVSNHRSIMEPVELSMIAVDRDRPATRGFDLLPERVLTLVGVYGPNASGKSNVLDALAWLSMAVSTSLRGWDETVPRVPFRFRHGPASPSSFEVELIVNGVRHTYRLEVNDTAVLFEGLYGYPERRRRTIFEREGMDLTFRRGLGGRPGTLKLLTPTTLAISAAMRLDEPEIGPVGRFLANLVVRGLSLRRGFPTRQWGSTLRLFADRSLAVQPTLFADPATEPFDRASALALLRFADLDVDDVEIREAPSQFDSESRPTAVRRPYLVHMVSGQRVAFDLNDESEGTQTLFGLIGPVMHALQAGLPLVVDEIDRSLHPRLSARLLEMFQDPATNPRGAQLIFTTHDTSLLNQLNRDEVWLTEKVTSGATTLTALAEYGGDKVRRSLNLERAYLQGRFGALPDLDQTTVRRVLGIRAGDDDG